MKRSILPFLAAALLVACGGDETTKNNANCGVDARCSEPEPDMGDGSEDTGGGTEDTGTDPVDMSTNGDVGTDMAMASCGREPAAADRARKVVVAKPFTNSQYEVFDLSMTGDLTRPNVTFDMGKGAEGEIQFTPDGELGYAVQDDGTIGIFRFNSSGQPEVLQAAHDPGFYVSGAVIDSTGDYLYAWETGFRIINDETHGAMYRLPLDCATGLPGEPKDVFAAGKLIRGAAFLSDDRMAVAAVDLLDDETANDVHLMDLAGPSRVASATAFGSMDAITAGFDVTADGNFALIGDNSLFSDDPNSVVAVAIDGDTLTPGQSFAIGDPVRIVTSPFDNAAIVLSTTEDEINVLGYDPNAAEPFTLEGPLDVTDSTLLPLGAAMIERGSLTGLVIVGENVAVRRVQFEENGTVTDLGILALGGGVESITGAVGVQP